MNGAAPRVSIVIPLHNAAGTIGDALRSLLAQSMHDWEAIVVDDGSTDGGACMAAKVAAGDPRFIFMTQANNGLASARNLGIDRARGRFVHFLDADDWLLPDALERLTRAAEKTGATYGGSAWFDAAGRSLGWSYAPSCPLVGRDELLEFNRFTPGAQIIRRDLLGTDRFDPRATGAEDHDLWLRLASRGVRWRAVDCDVAAYRLRPAGMSRDHARMARGRRFALERALAASDPRRDRLLLDAVLSEATASAWSDDPPGFKRSIAILRENAPATRIGPAEVARAAAWSLPFAACLPPTAWNQDGPVFERLCNVCSRWWRTLERAGLSPPGVARSARRELAALIVPPEHVAESIARTIPPADDVVLLGLGRNAAALAPALARADRRFAGFDDALAGSASTVRLAGVNVPILSEAEAFQPGRSFVVTPERDGAFASRLPAGARVIRWRESAAALASGEELRLVHAWPARETPALEAAA